jgi:ADP-ribose pyrophosphatase
MRTVITAELKKWEKRGESRTLAKQHGLSLQEQTFINPKTGKEDDYTWFTKNTGFTVVPITKDGNLVLVRQYKQAVDDIVLEFPCGVMKKDEAGTAAALREILEETGYASENVQETSAGMIRLAPRKSTSGFHTYVARDCHWTDKQSLDEGEDAIEVLEASREEVEVLILNGGISSTESVNAYFLARLSGHIQ